MAFQLEPDISKVLFLGEGNFSFSKSLFRGPWKHISFEEAYATCFEAHIVSDFAQENVATLKESNVKVLQNVDATQLNHKLKDKEFDLVVFMFPHIGGKMKIQKNRQLVKHFAVNLNKNLSPRGKVIVTLAGGQGGTPFDDVQRAEADTWQIIKTMAYGNFELVHVEKFAEFSAKLQCYQSHGYRGWTQGFHTEKGVVHVFQRPLKIPEPYHKTSTCNKDRYVNEKVRLLCYENCVVGQKWHQIATKFGIDPYDVIVTDQKPNDPGAYVQVLTQSDLSKCPIKPLIVTKGTVQGFSEMTPNGNTIINVMESDEPWQLLWKCPPQTSLYPPEYNHCISFWLPGQCLDDLEDLSWGLRVAGSDSVVSCQLIDVYETNGRTANTFRIHYKSFLLPLSPKGVMNLQQQSIGGYFASIGCSMK